VFSIGIQAFRTVKGKREIRSRKGKKQKISPLHNERERKQQGLLIRESKSITDQMGGTKNKTCIWEKRKALFHEPGKRTPPPPQKGCSVLGSRKKYREEREEGSQ